MNEAAKPHNSLIDYPPFLLLKSYTYFSRHVQTALKHIQKRRPHPAVSPSGHCRGQAGTRAPPAAVWRADGWTSEVWSVLLGSSRQEAVVKDQGRVQAYL